MLPSTPRRLVLALALLGFAPNGLGPAPASASPAELARPTASFDAVVAGSIGIRSHTYWVDGAYLQIVGDVQNSTSVRHEFVEVIATYYNASDQILGTDFTFAKLSSLAAGNIAPFTLLDDLPPGFDHYTLALDTLTPADSPVGAVGIVEGVHYTDSFGYRHYVGEIRNRNNFTVEFNEVIVTLLDGSGNVINSDFTFTNPHQIAANGAAPFDLVVFDHHAGTATYRLQVDARRESDFALVTSWDNYFDDIHASIFGPEIVWIGNAGITLGCATALFCPTLPVTREQMASFLVRALDLPPPPPSEPNGGDYFVDDEDSIHENDINALRYANITTGCGTDNVPGSPTIGQPIYCPTLTVTREQMATFISRAQALPDPPSTEPNGGDYFTDDDDPDSALHEPHINRLRYAQITRGCNEAGTLYCPDLPVTREQMAAFLYRALTD